MTAGFQRPPNIIVIAGSGSLPLELARHAERPGQHVGLVAVAGFSDQDLTGYDSVTLGIGEVGRLKSLLQGAGVPIVVSGRFLRPDLDSVSWDWGIVPILPKVLKSRIGGDDSATRTLSGILDDWGVDLLGPADIAPSMTAQTGPLSGGKPKVEALADIRTGFALISATAPFDVGQSVIMHHTRCIAVEAAEGTDAMIARCRELRANGRLRAKGKAGVLIKCAKPGQDLRTDMPVIGPDTIEGAVAANLAGIALEAGHVLIADREAVLERARLAGLFIYGADRGELGSRRP